MVENVGIGASLTTRNKCLQRIRTIVEIRTTTRNHGASSPVGAWTDFGIVIFPSVVSETRLFGS